MAWSLSFVCAGLAHVRGREAGGQAGEGQKIPRGRKKIFLPAWYSISACRISACTFTVTFVMLHDQTRRISSCHLGEDEIRASYLTRVLNVVTTEAECQCLGLFPCNGNDTKNGYPSPRALFGAEFHSGHFLNVASVIHQCIVASTVYLSRGVTQLTPDVSTENVAGL